MPGPNFFLSPLEGTQLATDMTVTYSVPSSVAVSDDSLVSLLLWNTGE